jgi:hypothetical protein
MDPAAVIRNLANGLIREEHVPWQDYQQLVSLVIRRQNLELLASSEVTVSDHEHSGEIDIVIRYWSPEIKIGSDKSAREESIFVECKRRGRKLELDDVGKVFCYSIVHQPRALYIVSPFPLAPQAIACARQLFAVEGFPPGLFRQTRILHRTLKELLNTSPAKTESNSSNVRVEGWSVILEDVFRREIVADESSCPAVIEVPPGAAVVLEIVVSAVEEVEVSATLSSSGQPVGKTRKQLVTRSTPLQFQFEVLSEPVVVDGIQIESCGTGNVRLHALRSVEFVLGSPADVFGDLRHQEVIEFADDLATQRSPRVTAILGEAGVGKSYFCEAVARRLKTNHDFSTFQAVATTHDDQYIFLSLLRHFFLPTLNRRSGNSREGMSDLPTDPEISILSTIISVRAEQGHTSAALAALFSRMIAGAYESSDPSLLLDAIAAAIRCYPRRQLIVIKNCHLLSTRAAVLLRMLIGRLESEGWGGFRLLLEYREENGNQNRPWERAISEIARDLRNRFRRFLISPLTLQQLIARVCNHIEAPSSQLTAEILLRQAGGNPLFLEHVMRDLLQSKVVVRDPSGGKFYRIDHFDLFRRRIEILPAELDALLRFRVQQTVAEAPGELRDCMAAYLGLASVITSSAGIQSVRLDEPLLAAAIGCSSDLLPRIRHRLVANAIMKGSLLSPPAEFAHDLMAAAAIGSVITNGHFRDAALGYCGLVRPESVSDAIVGGRLSNILGRWEEAVAFFENGLRLSEIRGHFLEQRRCLEGIRDVLETAEGLDTVSAARRTSIWLKLVWNELQQGSQYAAEQFIAQTRVALQKISTPQVIEAGIAELVERELSRYQVILDMRQADVLSFSVHARHYIDISNDVADLHYAATRVLLMSLHLCLPKLAWQAAEIAASSLESADPMALSSLYSDLGHFFLIEQPFNTEALWIKGLQVLEDGRDRRVDERQRAHSLANVLLISAVLRPDDMEFQTITSRCDDLAERGLTNPFLRLQNCLGALRLYHHDVDGAVREWRKGLQVARASSTAQYEWPYCHNLALASLRRGEESDAIDWLARCHRCLKSLLTCCADASVIEPLVGALKRKATIRQDHNGVGRDTLLLSPGTYTSIDLSGLVLRFIHTDRLLGELTTSGVKSGRRLSPEVGDLPINNKLLPVECLGRVFFLAVE